MENSLVSVRVIQRNCARSFEFEHDHLLYYQRHIRHGACSDAWHCDGHGDHVPGVRPAHLPVALDCRFIRTGGSMTLVDLSNPGRSLTRDPANTVTVVLPAYREEANIESTAEDFLSTLETGGYDHWLVIVNDGSPDATGAIADRLEHSYPGRVRAVHHSANQGYGAAVRTGIRTALDETDSAKIFLTDSDGQFKAEELIGFLQVAQSERAGVVIG